MSNIYDEFEDLPVSLIGEIKELSKGLNETEKKKVLKMLLGNCIRQLKE